MGRTRIEVHTRNSHCVSDLTLQCSGSLINVAQMSHPNVGEWMHGHVALFAGSEMTGFRSFDYAQPSQELMARIVERALSGLNFKARGQ